MAVGIEKKAMETAAIVEKWKNKKQFSHFSTIAWKTRKPSFPQFPQLLLLDIEKRSES